ncbi:MAG: PIN domain-containing protein [Candidatus Vecturithrix sp.]|jgi:PIN domain nuclease of toxin-antitoxin system|nr:PIN domain-containing protein [Candidatus Vecturithrix sp.]
MIYLDTHVVVWLYLGDLLKFSTPAKTAINANELNISPIVALELTYLHEIGRLKPSTEVVLAYLANRLRLKCCDIPFEKVIASAMKQTWTRDPFDRIIVGHAAIKECDLVTKDEHIHNNYVHAIW